ncbi:hypothetical protein BLNAU_18663 [Blattamonas nauphoetae]|uniref:Uncharacterized protein n=1 Tax=Blattamonas nauphoetae TaxID=2049346 RepID=A0ABQ9X3R4_9EUKA|nr:hypothetical protein BLNAU_18663 [Blattamonas nauphoetae]
MPKKRRMCQDEWFRFLDCSSTRIFRFNNSGTVCGCKGHANPIEDEGVAGSQCSHVLVPSAPLRQGFPTLAVTFTSRSKRQCVEKGKSIESTTSGPHEDVTALTRQAKRSEAGVDHDATWLITVVIHPNRRTFSPAKWLNTIEFSTTPPPQSPFRSFSSLPSSVFQVFHSRLSKNDLHRLASFLTVQIPCSPHPDSVTTEASIDTVDSEVGTWLEKGRTMGRAQTAARGMVEGTDSEELGKTRSKSLRSGCLDDQSERRGRGRVFAGSGLALLKTQKV